MLQPLFDSNRDRFSGNLLARVELMQYGDLQSKRCPAAYAGIKFLQEIMGSQLKFVFNGSNDFESLYKTCQYVLSLEKVETNYIEKNYFNHTINHSHIF
ncbi:MAG: hypothetical protein ABIR15_14725 [Chitinophagaceae bacterium]